MFVNNGNNYKGITITIWIIYTSCLHGSEPETGRRKLLLVGYDGFRWDYTSFVDTPNLDRVRSEGVKTHHMEGVFPSVTIPSFYAIATGLYPGSSGIIGNFLYDPHLNISIDFNPIYLETFDYSQNTSVWYSEGEPIWVTAGKSGLKTASYYWPGNEALIKGYKPDYVIHYSESYSFNDQVDQTIRWFVEQDVDLVLLYILEPDETAHRTGPAPESQDTLDMIRKCDDAMGYLLKELEENNLLEEVNMVVVSDHGFTSMPVPNQLIAIYDLYIDPADIQAMVIEWIIGNILPVEGRTEKVYNLLKGAHPHLKVYKKEDFPDRFHYKESSRVLPIVVVPDPGWLVVDNVSNYNYELRGTHGYDNQLMSMKPMFMARGPDIKQGYTSPVIRQVDIYSLLCKLMHLTPAPNNGSLTVIGQILNMTGYETLNQPIIITETGLIIVMVIGSILVLVLSAISIYMIYIRCRVNQRGGSPGNGLGDYELLLNNKDAVT